MMIDDNANANNDDDDNDNVIHNFNRLAAFLC